MTQPEPEPGKIRVDPGAVVHHLEQIIAKMAHDYAIMAAQLDAAITQLDQADRQRQDRVAAATTGDHGE